MFKWLKRCSSKKTELGLDRYPSREQPLEKPQKSQKLHRKINLRISRWLKDLSRGVLLELNSKGSKVFRWLQQRKMRLDFKKFWILRIVNKIEEQLDSLHLFLQPNKTANLKVKVKQERAREVQNRCKLTDKAGLISLWIRLRREWREARLRVREIPRCLQVQKLSILCRNTKSFRNLSRRMKSWASRKVELEPKILKNIRPLKGKYRQILPANLLKNLPLKRHQRVKRVQVR